MDIAEAYRGQNIHEIRGGEQPDIVRFFEEIGKPEFNEDEIPWCAAFVGACLYEANYGHSGSALAWSYADWDGADQVDDPQYGDIAVSQGHVTFFVQWNQDGTFNGLGGNQGDAVNVMRIGYAGYYFMRPNGRGTPKLETPLETTEAPPPDVLLPQADNWGQSEDLKITQETFDLIVAEEVTSQALYEKQYTGFEWPGGASGPTAGIGYDCGYVDAAELQADWEGIIEPKVIAKLQAARGRTGEEARKWVALNKGRVNITWYQALTQFAAVGMPKWIERTNAALPNCNLITPGMFGVLVSITYNRGPDWTTQEDRRAEMNAIYRCLAAGDFGPIPDLIRSMARLWPGTGLVGRRYREADIFEAELQLL